MVTVIWEVDVFHVVHLMTSQRSFNSEYFVSHVLALMAAKVFHCELLRTLPSAFERDACFEQPDGILGK
jgi:hypothetical protein